MSSDNFLSRWSRRKQAARSREQPEAAATRSEPVVPPEEDASAMQAEAGLSADEIASLPSIEDLTAETDVSVFLRKGVPEPLRNAALRRMWSLDAKIREFVGDARDYAYDWNTPGGVPGFGPLPTTEEVLRMAARIVGGDTSKSESGGKKAPHTESQNREPPLADSGASDMHQAMPLSDPAPTPRDEPDLKKDDGASLTPLPWSSDVADTNAARALPLDRTPEDLGPALRRHGGALPL
jgi:hypothetical protein